MNAHKAKYWTAITRNYFDSTLERDAKRVHKQLVKKEIKIIKRKIWEAVFNHAQNVIYIGFVPEDEVITFFEKQKYSVQKAQHDCHISWY